MGASGVGVRILIGAWRACWNSCVEQTSGGWFLTVRLGDDDAPPGVAYVEIVFRGDP